MKGFGMVRGAFSGGVGIEKDCDPPEKILGVLPLKMVHSGAFFTV